MRSYRPNIVSGLAYIEISITSAKRPHVECEIEPTQSGDGRQTPTAISIRSPRVVVAIVSVAIDVDVDVVFGVQVDATWRHRIYYGCFDSHSRRFIWLHLSEHDRRSTIEPCLLFNPHGSFFSAFFSS